MRIIETPAFKKQASHEGTQPGFTERRDNAGPAGNFFGGRSDSMSPEGIKSLWKKKKKKKKQNSEEMSIPTKML